MSDTPRTDEYERSAAIEAIEYGKGRNPIDFARRLERELAEAKKDSARLDWLADPDNRTGNVQLPSKCVLQNLDSMRHAIDAAMEAGE